jgi:hypothetical protein
MEITLFGWLFVLKNVAECRLFCSKEIGAAANFVEILRLLFSKEIRRNNTNMGKKNNCGYFNKPCALTVHINNLVTIR